MADQAHTLISRAEARSQGLKRYFTGKPCKHGHVRLRQVSNGVCIECSKHICKRYSLRNQEKVRNWVREYAKARPEWRREKGRASYLRHRESRQESNRRWHDRNRDRIKLYIKQWIEENRDKKRAAHRNRKARKRQNGGSHTAADVNEIFKWQRGKCAYCPVRLDKNFHVDHITPLSKGGSNDRKNLQLLCGPCNLSKSARDPIDFMRSLGRLL